MGATLPTPISSSTVEEPLEEGDFDPEVSPPTPKEGFLQPPTYLPFLWTGQEIKLDLLVRAKRSRKREGWR